MPINSREKFVTLVSLVSSFGSELAPHHGGLNRLGASRTRWSLRVKTTQRSEHSETITLDGGLWDPRALSFYELM